MSPKHTTSCFVSYPVLSGVDQTQESRRQLPQPLPVDTHVRGRVVVEVVSVDERRVQDPTRPSPDVDAVQYGFELEV